MRLEHCHRLLNRNVGFNSLGGTLPAFGNQRAQASLDIVKAAEALVPSFEQAKKPSVDRPPELEALFKLAGLEDRRDAFAVDLIGAVGRDRVCGEIRRK